MWTQLQAHSIIQLLINLASSLTDPEGVESVLMVLGSLCGATGYYQWEAQVYCGFIVSVCFFLTYTYIPTHTNKHTQTHISTHTHIQFIN
jgi:hypothetical protein